MGLNYKRNICRFCGLLTAVLAITLAACGETAVSPESLVVSPESLVVTREPLTVTHEPLADPTITISRSHAITPTPSLTPSSPTPTPDPYADLTIDALTARSYGGGELDILEILEETETFTRYLISYPSDGLTIYGYMNVPHEGDKFPVALMLHGYIEPAVYKTVTYTRRYADALAEAGYFVIHPNFRNYPPSESGDNPFRIGYAIDTLNLIAIIREQSLDPTGYLRRADRERIHLWGHSMGGGVALRVVTVNNEPYIRAAVLYASMSGDEQKNFEKIVGWSNGRSGTFELAASSDTLAAISPINHLERITAPISIHHSEADDIVPIAWSNELCERLQAI
ncbi:MAG: alpha/beta fold hydrolase, partial [Chloroflexi bacterium]|nr:alpha/beta fold hydrolase [Chloroflexota bacterium]